MRVTICSAKCRGVEAGGRAGQGPILIMSGVMASVCIAFRAHKAKAPNLFRFSGLSALLSNQPDADPTYMRVVPRRGLEPPHLAAHGPEPCASTNSATWALGSTFVLHIFHCLYCFAYQLLCLSGPLESGSDLNSVVPRRGLEPPHLAAHGPEPCASTNSATWALKDNVRTM